MGGLFGINGKVLGMECFGHWQTFSKFFKKLIQSYALDAIGMLEEPKADHFAAMVGIFLGNFGTGPPRI